MRSLLIASLLSVAPADSEPPPAYDYKGVAPGNSALPPRAPRPKGKPGAKERQQLLWSGFQVRQGTPTVFLETTRPPEYQVTANPGTVTILLKEASIPLRNNRRALDVSQFATALKEVQTEPAGRDIRVTIKALAEKEVPRHRERVEEAAGGYHLLVIELVPTDGGQVGQQQ